MTGEQIAKLIMVNNELGKSRGLLTDLLKEGGEFSIRIAMVLDKLKECEDELNRIQNGK
ncbi:MAG: hypothetical protein ACM3X9_02935 [Bacillota bacterium]